MAVYWDFPTPHKHFLFLWRICQPIFLYFFTFPFFFPAILAFLFFSGDLDEYIPHDVTSSYVAEYTPTLNYFLVPVFVSCVAKMKVWHSWINQVAKDTYLSSAPKHNR